MWALNQHADHFYYLSIYKTDIQSLIILILEVTIVQY